jgi:hypothetical protein
VQPRRPRRRARTLRLERLDEPPVRRAQLLELAEEQQLLLRRAGARGRPRLRPRPPRRRPPPQRHQQPRRRARAPTRCLVYHHGIVPLRAQRLHLLDRLDELPPAAMRRRIRRQRAVVGHDRSLSPCITQLAPRAQRHESYTGEQPSGARTAGGRRRNRFCHGALLGSCSSVPPSRWRRSPPSIRAQPAERMY